MGKAHTILADAVLVGSEPLAPLCLHASLYNAIHTTEADQAAAMGLIKKGGHSSGGS